MRQPLLYIGVLFNIRITHKSIGQTNEQWDLNRQEFSNKYQDQLPIKIKKTPNYSLDYFLQIEATIPGIPKDAIILELGIGKNLFETWKTKYKIND